MTLLVCKFLKQILFLIVENKVLVRVWSGELQEGNTLQGNIRLQGMVSLLKEKNL